MAVLDDLEGIEVSICIDDKPLPEYSDDEEADFNPGKVAKHQAKVTVSKYIESVTDKEFSIRLSIHPSYDLRYGHEAVAFPTLIDGVRVRRTLFQLVDSNKFSEHGWTHDLRGVHSYDGTKSRAAIIQKFKFAAIGTTTDDDKLNTVQEDQKRLDETGEIVVWVHRKRDPAPIGIDGVKKHTPKVMKDYGGKVHEKALKGQAKSHSTLLGDAEPSNPSLKYRSRYVDGKDYPVAIFKFKYRSKEALKQLHITRLSPPSLPPKKRKSKVKAEPKETPVPPPVPRSLKREREAEDAQDGPDSRKQPRMLADTVTRSAVPDGLRGAEVAEKVTVDLTGDDD